MVNVDRHLNRSIDMTNLDRNIGVLLGYGKGKHMHCD